MLTKELHGFPQLLQENPGIERTLKDKDTIVKGLGGPKVCETPRISHFLDSSEMPVRL
jgi:hypothetical protein